MSRSTHYGILVAAAILGAMAIADGLGNTRSEPVKEPTVEKSPAPEQATAANSGDPDRIPVSKRAKSLGFDENSADPHRLTCMQLQVIEEIDLIGDADCD